MQRRLPRNLTLIKINTWYTFLVCICVCVRAYGIPCTDATGIRRLVATGDCRTLSTKALSILTWCPFSRCVAAKWAPRNDSIMYVGPELMPCTDITQTPRAPEHTLCWASIHLPCCLLTWMLLFADLYTLSMMAHAASFCDEIRMGSKPFQGLVWNDNDTGESVIYLILMTSRVILFHVCTLYMDELQTINMFIWHQTVLFRHCTRLVLRSQPAIDVTNHLMKITAILFIMLGSARMFPFKIIKFNVQICLLWITCTRGRRYYHTHSENHSNTR